MRRWSIACAAACAWSLSAVAQPAPATITRDVAFLSHDGRAMAGRLTLPDTPGQHAVLLFVQNAEASTMDQRLRNAKGEVVAFFDLYRENLAPMNAGFFSALFDFMKRHVDEKP